jgi:hypothetical protein
MDTCWLSPNDRLRTDYTVEWVEIKSTRNEVQGEISNKKVRHTTIHVLTPKVPFHSFSQFIAASNSVNTSIRCPLFTATFS